MDCIDEATFEARKDPKVLQFFVKWLGEKTVVMRESERMSMGELKAAVLELMAKGSDEKCLSSMFCTFEGRALDEGLNIGEVGVAPGGTLHMCLRFQNTVSLTVPESAQPATPTARLHLLVRKLIEGKGHSELSSGILEEMCLILRPSGDQTAFEPSHLVNEFVREGGVEAVTSLLDSKFSFLAFSCVELVAERIANLPTEHPLRFVALYIGWHLREAFLEKAPEISSDIHDQCLESLSCLANFQGHAEAEMDVWNFFPHANGKHRWKRFRTKICKLSVRKGQGASTKKDMERDVVRGLVEKLSEADVTFFRSLPEQMEFVHQHRLDADQATFKEHNGNSFNHLSKALKTILRASANTGLAYRNIARKLAPRKLKPKMTPTTVFFGAEVEGGLKSPTIRSSVSHLSTHLMNYAAMVVEGLVDLAEIDEELKERLTALIGEERVGLTAMASHQTTEFCGMRKLAPLFERSYRHLWPVSLKERWIRKNLPTPGAEALTVTVQRDHNMLATAFNRIGGAKARELHQGIAATFRDGRGYGPVVTREFLVKVAEALFNPDFALFRTAPANRRRIFPNANSGVNPLHLEYFRFCGRVVALALAHKVQVGVTFCSALLDALWEHNSERSGPVTDGHVAAKEIDPELYDACEKLLRMSEDEFSGLGLTFVYSRESLGAHQECELIPGGSDIEVNFNQRELFVKLKVQAQLLDPVKDQIDALREGMRSVFTQGDHAWQRVYGVLTEQEFASLLQGAANELSIDDWKAHTTYHDYTENDKVIERFWRAVHRLTPEQQRNLLHFATAVRYLPSTGFAGLPDRFHIWSTESEVDTLPTSHAFFPVGATKVRVSKADNRTVTDGYAGAYCGRLWNRLNVRIYAALVMMLLQ